MYVTWTALNASCIPYEVCSLSDASLFQETFLVVKRAHESVHCYLSRVALGRKHAQIVVEDKEVAAAFDAECQPTWRDGW